MTSPWVAPDAGVDAIPTVQPPPVPAAPASTARTLPPFPVPLEPLTASAILDGAFTAFRRRFRTMLLLTIGFVVPLQLLIGWLSRDFLRESSFDAILAEDGSQTAGSGSSTLGPNLVAFASSFILTFVCASIAVVLAGWMVGRDVSIGEALGKTLRRSPSLVVAWVIVHLAEAAGVIGAFVGSLLLMGLFTVVTPAIAVEELGPFKGVARGAGLAKRHYGKALGVSLLVAIVNLGVSNAITAIPQLLALVLPQSVAWLSFSVGNVAAALITEPFTAITAVLLYFDLRMRQEGLDLQLRSTSVFDG